MSSSKKKKFSFTSFPIKGQRFNSCHPCVENQDSKSVINSTELFKSEEKIISQN